MNKRRHLTQMEVEQLLSHAKAGSNPDRDYCLVYMSFVHGFRVSEICQVRLSDMDLQAKSLYIRRIKNGLNTNHPLLDNEIRAIRAWLRVRRGWSGAESDWLFLSRQGRPLTRQRVHQLISSLGAKAGIAVASHPHMLRHACGFALADRGIDTRLIQDYLGHKNIRHTVHYTASNAERFGGIWQNINRKKSGQIGPNC